MRTQPIFALVNSGFQVADFPALHGAEGALYVPTVDSCTAALRASWDQTSANYLPVKYNAVPASGQVLTSLQDITIPVGPGGAYYALARLRREFEDPDGPGLDAARFALRKMIAAVRSPQYPWPIAEPARMRHLVP